MGSVVNVRLPTQKLILLYDGLHFRLPGQQPEVQMGQGSLGITKAAAKVSCNILCIFQKSTIKSTKTQARSSGSHNSAWCSWFITFDCNSFIVIERSLVRFWERRKPFFLHFLRPQKIITVFRRHAERLPNAALGAECFEHLIKPHHPNAAANFSI